SLHPPRTSPHRPLLPYSTLFRSCWSARAALANPMRGRSSKTSTAPIRSPRMSTVPAVACIREAASCTTVVLPAPLGPSTTQRSPSSTDQASESRVGCVPRRTVTSSNWSTSPIASEPNGSARPARPGAPHGRSILRPARYLRQVSIELPRSVVLSLWLERIQLEGVGVLPDALAAVQTGDEPHQVHGSPDLG